MYVIRQKHLLWFKVLTPIMGSFFITFLYIFRIKSLCFIYINVIIVYRRRGTKQNYKGVKYQLTPPRKKQSKIRKKGIGRMIKIEKQMVIPYLLLIFVLVQGYNFLFDNSHKEYFEVKVVEGDSLWKIGERTQNKHGMNTADFVNWAENENHIYSTIKPGDVIRVPIAD